jgi:hypothetical protein
MPIVNNEGQDHNGLVNDSPPQQSGNDAYLVSWVMGKVKRWREHRDVNYLQDWNDYYNLWRGKWQDNLRAKTAERSKLIAPALQQAVDQTHAEMVEAVFGRATWIDIDDDIQSANYQQAQELRDQLLEDFKKANTKGALIEGFLNGCLYGTGIWKAIIDEPTEWRISSNEYGEAQADGEKKFLVKWQAIPPDNFVIDPSALTIDQAMGIAHEMIKPRYAILSKQQAGDYIQTPIGGMSGMLQTLGFRPERGEVRDIRGQDGVYITEYHGLVPSYLLDDSETEHDELANELRVPLEGNDVISHFEQDDKLEEAIVIIANGGILLKKVKNPILTKDRAFVAYPHDRVPNRFWGRGVCEKGINSQKALDAELRARIDALGLLTYPVMGADATRLPRNLNLQVVPGKTFLTNGRPSEVLEPITFGNLQPATFQQSGDLERMVQMATGAADSATPTDINSKNTTASGISMQAGAVIKRAKLTMQNVDEALNSLVRKSLIRYMQFDQERYPMDLDFTVCSTMSIMAKEFEQVQMTNLLAIIPPESPAYLMILKAIIDNYSGPSKAKLCAAIEQMMKPDPQQQKMQQMQAQLQMQSMANEVQRGQSEIAKIQKEIQKIEAEIQNKNMDTHLMPVEAQAKVAEVIVQNKQIDHQHKVDTHNTLIDAHKAVSDRIKATKPEPEPKASGGNK